MFLKVISFYMFIYLEGGEAPVHMHGCQRRTLGVLQSSLEIESLALSGDGLTVIKSQWLAYLCLPSDSVEFTGMHVVISLHVLGI